MLRAFQRLGFVRSVVTLRPSEATAEPGSNGPPKNVDEPPVSEWNWPFHRQLAAGSLVSLLVHLAVLILIALVPMPQTNRSLYGEITSWMADEPQLEESLSDPVMKIAEPSDRPESTPLSSDVLGSAPLFSEAAPSAEQPVNMTELVEDSPAIVPPPLESFVANRLDDVLILKGGDGEAVAHVEGAVDRISYEIATNLEQSNVLVVWLMDASLSLADDREAVADRLSRIYQEIGQMGTVHGDALWGAVYRYGKDFDELVAPTADGNKVVDAIRRIKNDESGIENVFTCIQAVVNRYKPLRARNRKIMVVVWTDESGDDGALLEDTVEMCRKLAVPVYTVGPSSMFGRQEGTQQYKHPENGEVYDLPVARGPDTPRPEMLRLPFWFRGPQLSSMRAGVGPFALTRLARETGGAYFLNDNDADKSPFDLEVMRRYLPGYGPPEEYLKQVKSSRLRQAVLRSVDLTYERELKDTPRLSFAPTGDNFQQELREAQETVAYNLLTLDQATSLFGSNGLEADYEKERDPRWRAWYDLTFGRLLAMQVRCNEYNLACAMMKGKGAEFVNKQSNRWEFHPDGTVRGGTVAERKAEEATRLLKRCVQENPGTPWARLAERELAFPLGFAISEEYVPPPVMRNNVAVNNNPPEMPPGRREEELRRLRRESVTLPKL